MARVILLGGGGFIGTNLAEALATADHEVAVFTRTGNPTGTARKLNYEWLEGDFTNTEHLRAAIAGRDVVYHLVSSTLPQNSNSNPLFDVTTNVAGTVELLEAARSEGVARIVFLSSGGTVYGIPRHLPIDEDHPTDPISSYGITKLAIEKYLGLYAHLYGLNHSIIRLSNPFGPHQRPNTGQGAIATFLDRAIKGQPIEIWGDGSVVRDYIYVTDATRALVDILKYRGPERVFNVGSGEGTSLSRILDLISQLLGHQPEVVFRPSKPHDVPVNYVDTSRIRQAIGWAPLKQLDEGLSLTIEFLRRS